MKYLFLKQTPIKINVANINIATTVTGRVIASVRLSLSLSGQLEFTVEFHINGSLVTFPQTTALTDTVHTPPFIGALVQVMLVCVDVVGQLPQFDEEME